MEVYTSDRITRKIASNGKYVSDQTFDTYRKGIVITLAKYGIEFINHFFYLKISFKIILEI